MEADTGAAVFVISEETYKELFMNLSLKKASVSVKPLQGKNTCLRRTRGGNVLSRAESSFFLDGSERQGSKFERDLLMHF